jgi:hypothetical protein
LLLYPDGYVGDLLAMTFCFEFIANHYEL